MGTENCQGNLTKMLGYVGYLRWTSIPSRGSSNIPSRFILIHCSGTYFNLLTFPVSCVLCETNIASVQLKITLIKARSPTNLSVLCHGIHFNFPRALDKLCHHNGMVLNSQHNVLLYYLYLLSPWSIITPPYLIAR